MNCHQAICKQKSVSIDYKGTSTHSEPNKGTFTTNSKMKMQLETYNSSKLLNFVKSEGILPVKFFPDNLLPKYQRPKIRLVINISCVYLLMPWWDRIIILPQSQIKSPALTLVLFKRSLVSTKSVVENKSCLVSRASVYWLCTEKESGLLIRDIPKRNCGLLIWDGGSIIKAA